MAYGKKTKDSYLIRTTEFVTASNVHPDSLYHVVEDFLGIRVAGLPAMVTIDPVDIQPMAEQACYTCGNPLTETEACQSDGNCIDCFE